MVLFKAYIDTCKKILFSFRNFGICLMYIGKLSLFSQIEWANISVGNEIPFAFILDL